MRPLLSNESRMIDRFGLLTLVTIATIVLLMLINVDPQQHGVLHVWEMVGASILVAITLVLALRASGLSRRYQRVADIMVLLVITVVIIVGIVESLGGRVTSTAGPAPGFVVILAVCAPIAVIARLVRHREITRGTLLGAISGYLLIAVAFFYLFMLVGEFSGDHFFGERETTQAYMYFSLVTITTTGYGDLTAHSDLGRLLATSEAVIGQIYLVTFVAMIVGLFVAGRQTFRLSGDPDASGENTPPR
jgi:hypothetical protein